MPLSNHNRTLAFIIAIAAVLILALMVLFNKVAPEPQDRPPQHNSDDGPISAISADTKETTL